MKFDYCISNPPYQKPSSTSTTVSSIFHHFQKLADTVSHARVLIYPAGRWLQRGGKGMAEFGYQQTNDTDLVSVNVLPAKGRGAVFPTARINDEVSIVYKNSSHVGDTFILDGVEVHYPGDRILPRDARWGPVVEKIHAFMDKNSLPSLTHRSRSRSLFGIESDFVERNQEKVRPIHQGSDGMRDPITIITNDRAGVSGRSAWYWIERDLIPQGRDCIGKYQYVIKSAQFVSQYGQILDGIVLDNKSCHGRTKVSIITVDTMEEILNFEKYIRNPLMQRLYKQSITGGLSQLCAFIPDLGDYTDECRFLDWGAPVVEQLYDLFELSASERDFIESYSLKA